MEQPRDVLAIVADAVADGLPIDWAAAESDQLSPGEREMLSQLRVLEGVRSVHRLTPALESSGAADRITTDVSAAEDTTTRTETDRPRNWAHLELRDRLGGGGFGVVYRAWDPRLATTVALKLLTRITPGDGVVEEARLLARVRHPNVVTVYGADSWNGQVGLWMELVDGRTLKDALQERGPFSPREAALIGLDLTRALAAVHAAGLVHRDIKPQNVMRAEGGRIVLMDFGAGGDLLSRRLGIPAGTPLYMAPQLLGHQRATAQTDLYALGVLLFHLVTCSYPVDGSTMSEVQDAYARGTRRRLRDLRPDLPTEFVRIVERAIDADEAQRYGSAGEMEGDLARFVVAGETTDHGPVPRAPRRRWMAGVAAGVLLTAAAGAGIFGLQSWHRPPPVVTAEGLRSLVVLPFRNLSGDSNQDYFVDGMTELLTNELSAISALRVISRTSAMNYRGGGKPIPAIASELHVDGVVEGSVTKSGNHVRVTVKIIHAGADVGVWAHTYEREVNDAFSLQADIARTIAAEVRVALTDRERQQLTETYQADPKAVDRYLRGRFLINTYNRDNLQEARLLLEESVRIDPKYARAWATLARCYTLLETWSVLSPSEARTLATDAANQALSHDSTLVDAHMALAEVLFKFDWNWSAADQHYRRALEADPNSSLARGLYARFLAAAGRVGDAVTEAQRAEEADPVTSDTKRTLAMMLFYQRRYSDAEQKAAEAIALGAAQPGGHVVRGRALTALARYDDAIRELQEAVRLSADPGQLAELGRTFAVSGRKVESEAILDRLGTMSTASGDVVFAKLYAAYIQAALGRRDEAITGIEQAVQHRTDRVLWLRVDPRVDVLRDDRRFLQMIDRIGGLEGAK